MGPSEELPDVAARFARKFPRLSGSRYQITSPSDGEEREYNCVAWAMHDDEKWWVPREDYYWPDDTNDPFSLEPYEIVFKLAGYEECSDHGFEERFEKVAFFVDAQGLFTHVARQLGSGRWTSKLGDWEDIEHDLFDLEGDFYGRVSRIMKRQIKD